MKQLVFVFCFFPLVTMANENPYYDTWLIESHVPTSSLSALTYEEIKAYKGTKVVYTPQTAHFGRHHCSGAIYQKEEYSEAEFLQYSKIKLSELGIKENKITEILVKCKSASRGWQLGEIFYYSDPSALFINIEGVWIKLKQSNQIQSTLSATGD